MPVFTSVPIYDTLRTTPRGRYGDESPLVELDRQFIGNLDVHYIRAEKISPLAGMACDLELHDSPMHAAETRRLSASQTLNPMRDATAQWGGDDGDVGLDDGSKD